jgi:O-antigen ligase
VDNPGFLNGFQANRNSEADVLLIAALAAAFTGSGLVRTKGTPALVVGAATCAALLLGVAMTGSRMGSLLVLPVAALCAAILEPRLRRRRSAWVLGAVALAPLAAFAGALALHIGAVEAVAARFTLQRDVRADLWRDTWSAVGTYWPWGSGVGTFRDAFMPAERFAMIDTSKPVRAHNEALEYLLEGGLAAMMILLAILALLARAFVNAVRRAGPQELTQILFAAGVIGVAIVHSIVDYPFRSMALASLNAVALAILLAIARGKRVKAPGGLSAP